MSTLELRSVSVETGHDGSRYYTLNFVRGRHEATVEVEDNAADDSVVAVCRELWADSVLDEIVLEEAAEYWVRNHADVLGAIDFDDVVVDSAMRAD